MSSAPMGMSGLWEAATLVKDVLKCASSTSGAPCVTASGVMRRLVWPVDSWASPDQVS